MPSNELPERRHQSRSGRGRRWLMAPGCERPTSRATRALSLRHIATRLLSRGDLVGARSADCRDAIKQPPSPSRSPPRGSLSRSRRRFAMRRAERKQSARRGRPCIWPLITQTAIAGHCHRRYCFVGLAAQRVAVASIGRQWDSGPSRALDRSCAPIYRSRGSQVAPSADLRKRNSTTRQRN